MVNINQRWSKKQDSTLREMVINGSSTSEIANTLGRSRSAVWARKYKLGISRRIRRSSSQNLAPITRSSARKKPAQTVQQMNMFTPPPTNPPATRPKIAIGSQSLMNTAAAIAKANGIQVSVIVFDGTNG